MLNYFCINVNKKPSKTAHIPWNIFVGSMFVILLLPSFVGCGKSSSSALVGRWAIEGGQSTTNVPEDLELLKDGTGIVDKMGVTWKTEKGRLYYTASVGAWAHDYKIAGTTLTLTMDNGRKVTYAKDSGEQSIKSAKIKAAELFVKNMKAPLERFESHVGRFPTTEEGLGALLVAPSSLADPAKWDGPYIEDNVSGIDPWGNPYQYAYPGMHRQNKYDLWSMGSDEISDTEDDIGSWK